MPLTQDHRRPAQPPLGDPPPLTPPKAAGEAVASELDFARDLHTRLLDRSRMELRRLRARPDEELPIDLKIYRGLAGKRLLMCDDSQDYLIIYARRLVYATAGSASFLQCKQDDDSEDLARRIAQSGAEIVLLDFALSPSPLLNGVTIGRRLRELSSGKIVLFSDSPHVGTEIGSGDFISVKKSIDVDYSIGQLLEALGASQETCKLCPPLPQWLPPVLRAL